MTEQADAAEALERLRASLRWHFNCHAAEPDKSYASLGIENAENIVRDLLAAREAAARAEALREAADALYRGEGPDPCGQDVDYADWLQDRIARTDGAGS